VIDLIELSESPNLKPWIDGLHAPNLRRINKDRSEQAAWTGRPFILAGDKPSLLKWFRELDPSSYDLLKDHAYFWILTSDHNFDHELLPKDRSAVMDWRGREYAMVRASLDFLARFPKLAGLSKGMHHLRQEIIRIGTGSCEPATPVLILGESGSGKEGTAQSLFEVCSRSDKPGLFSIGGSWLDLDPGLALTELLGIPPGVATDVKGRPGLFAAYSEGAIFVDDFDTAPKRLQETLLRITSTPRGRLAKYRCVGGERDMETNVWLIFATNQDVTKMLKEGTLRPDFFFRFEDRVLMIPPLRDRKADLPAIACSIWSSLRKAVGSVLDDRPLPWRSLRDLHARDKLQWSGNVRELSALLSLAASMCKMPQHRSRSVSELMNIILARGDSSLEWIGVVASKEYSGAQILAPSVVEQIFTLDKSQQFGGRSGCENEVYTRLGETRWNEFQESVNDYSKPRDRDEIRGKFCRYLAFAILNGKITGSNAQKLSGLGGVQALEHLKWLAKSKKFLSEADDSSRLKYVFKAGEYLDGGG
jgi:DNA-binding NtrC family response regulator